MGDRPPLPALFGPTGVGKTAIAVALAERMRDRGEDPVAISADALQVYARLETLTGAASRAQQLRLEHRLVGTVAVTETFSAGRFAQLAHAEIDGALASGRTPILVGGTGLYLRAALCELDLRPPPPAGLREKLTARLSSEGPEALHAELTERAPERAAEIATADRSRLVRALELLEMGEQPAPAGAQSRLWTAELRHPTLLCGLTMQRETLYAGIDRRVEEMVRDGAQAEVHAADCAGASATARKALGFHELLAGDTEAMKRRTRNYAKRQLTWMRKLPVAWVIDVTARDPTEVAADIDQRALAERDDML